MAHRRLRTLGSPSITPCIASARVASAVALGLLAGTLSTVAPAAASWSVSAADERDNAVLLRDFVHYARVARTDLAAANGKALLDQLVAPHGAGTMSLTEFAKMVEASGELGRFEETALRGTRFGGELEGVATKLLRAYQLGKLEQARDPGEIIRNIGLLGGTARQRAVGRDRLLIAGEYAMPLLLDAFRSREGAQLRFDVAGGQPIVATIDAVTRAEVETTIRLLGRQAVAPLQAALMKVDATQQERLAALLGDIPVRSSLPFLYDLRASTKNPAVKVSAERAIAKLDNEVINDAPIGTLYEALAKAYYDQQDSLVSFPGESVQLLWSFDPQVGLVSTPIDSGLFHEAMAMRLSEQALRANPGSASALALWLASNFQREAQTPSGYVNPAYGATRPDAMFYAVAAGPAAVQRVLALGIDGKSAPLSRRAIGALEKTAGASALASGEAERRPLLEALRFPNRRVQYEAALVLANAGPREKFDGSDRVVPTLAGIVGEAGSRYAVVVALDAERRSSMTEQLKALGYTVLPAAERLSGVEQELAAAPSVELVYASLPTGATASLIDEARARAKTSTTPIVAYASPEAQAELNIRFGRDATVRLVREGLDTGQLEAAINQVVASASGGDISPEDAFVYQERAVSALRDIAVSGSPVFNLGDATGPLLKALEGTRGAMRLKMAEVLSYIGDARVQSALFDAAFASDGDEQVAMLGHVSSSAKRFGNQLADRQVKRLVELAGKAGPDAKSNAVAALLGSLNVRGNTLLPLIIGTQSDAPAGR